ncbi:Asp23/Gls24 family envelope stress response protein [Nocardia otitidiscaviarum]|uniref:Asp23/Gls24 family envelope stress response protein n=1 Tax=Nocardia otitidiscaviarum TaxID=1823 RepID=UPI0018933849|nr:Asp23/Gls24 family envelope stress response protein [Nocardia otitidiscaviarum]MBF6178625.1 Asp23/Gls24 family envelope stress response protein [Nocardia otitidiscaviarum]
MTAAVTVELPGTTTVSERAVRRLAAHAAAEVDGVGSQVGVDADVTSDAAALRVRLPVRYPLPVARIAESCRTHLIARVGELAGLTVTGVDIEISAMELEPAATATESARRRVR